MNHTTARLGGALALSAFVAVGAAADEECAPSRWGADDEIGSANLISAASVLAASKLVTQGKVYSLGITIDSTTPAFPPRGLSLQVVQPNQQEGARPFPNAVYNDDVFQGWFGIGPQIDGLGHIGGPDGMYYNCNHAVDFAGITGLTKLGIEKVPPLVARGIVLDMAGHFGVESMEAGEFFTVEDVQAVEAKQGTPVEAGSVVLFHTGWTDAKLLAAPDEWVAAEPGQHEDVAVYLAGKNVLAVGRGHLGLGRRAASGSDAAVPGSRDAVEGERDLHPGDDEHGAAGARRGVRVSVRARAREGEGRRADDHQSDRDSLTVGMAFTRDAGVDARVPG